MPTFAATVRASVVVVALAGSVAACATGGYYHPAAEAECRARGIDPQAAAYALCVKNVEDAEYRRWSRGAPGH